MSITKTPLPYAFTDGTVAYGSQVDTNFDAVWLDKDAVIDVVNEITAGTTAVPKATHAVNADNATTAVNAQTANNATNSDTLDGSHKDDIIAAASPAGSVTAFAGSIVPTGWLKCNGAAVSRTTYAALFGAIGVTYGNGDGISTFNLPDLRGEFIRGWDNDRGIDAGRALGSAQGDAIRNISGDFIASDDNGATGVFLVTDTGVGTESGGTAASKTVNFDASRVVPTASENRPRNIAMMYIIKH